MVEFSKFERNTRSKSRKYLFFFVSLLLFIQIFVYPVYATAIDLNESLLSAIESNISMGKNEFTINVENLSENDLKINLNDYFDSISSYRLSYSIVNHSPTNITYQVTYEIRYLVADAFKRGNTDKLDEQALAVYHAAKNIIKDVIKPDMNNFEKEKAIHDYIVLNTCYDKQNYDKQTIPQESYTPYGVLINKAAVCEGYSDTFKMFMDMLDIECDIIRGTANGEPHAWNRVKLDNQYYLVDVTWDDPTPDKLGVVRYNYFNLTDEVMTRDHISSQGSDKISNSTKYNYFYYYGFIINSQNDFEMAIQTALKDGVPSISLLGVNMNIKNIDLKKVFKYYPKSFYHSLDTGNNIITVYF